MPRLFKAYWVFCFRHENSFTSESYVNSRGRFEYGEDWGWPLRATARNAYWINVLMPCDLTAFYKVSDLIVRPDMEALDGAPIGAFVGSCLHEVASGN